MFFSKILGEIFAKHPEFLWNLRSFKHRRHAIDFKNPRDLYEFIAVSALKNGNNELWTKLADKYAVRDYVKETIGEEYLIPLLGKWNSPDEINFDALPEKFVLKTNNSSGTNILITNKKDINVESIKKKLRKWLEYPYGAMTAQPHYTHIKPCIIAEQFMDQGEGFSSLVDYKFYCANGKIGLISVISERKAGMHLCPAITFDSDWTRRADVTRQDMLTDRDFPKPECFEELKRIVLEYAKLFDFIRIDFYVINGRPYFGEFTFTPSVVDQLSPKGMKLMFDLVENK